jgi:hypothetical protein
MACQAIGSNLGIIHRPVGLYRRLDILNQKHHFRQTETECHLLLPSQIKADLYRSTGCAMRGTKTNVPAALSSRPHMVLSSAEAKPPVACSPSRCRDNGKDEDGHKEQQSYDGADQSEYATSQQMLGPLTIFEDDG